MRKLVKKMTALAVCMTAALALTACGGEKKGVEIGVPNDTTNEARALMLLEELGYITLEEGAGITATVLDIAENPYNITFNEVEAAQLPNVLQDMDYAVTNSNYAIDAGLNPMEDALALEEAEVLVIFKEAILEMLLLKLVQKVIKNPSMIRMVLFV